MRVTVLWFGSEHQITPEEIYRSGHRDVLLSPPITERVTNQGSSLLCSETHCHLDMKARLSHRLLQTRDWALGQAPSRENREPPTVVADLRIPNGLVEPILGCMAD